MNVPGAVVAAGTEAGRQTGIAVAHAGIAVAHIGIAVAHARIAIAYSRIIGNLWVSVLGFTESPRVQGTTPRV